MASAVAPRATGGENARDEIIVATTVQESLRPFIKEKPSPNMITVMRMGDMEGYDSFLCDLDDDISDDIGSLIAAIRRVAHMTVHLA